MRLTRLPIRRSGNWLDRPLQGADEPVDQRPGFL